MKKAPTIEDFIAAGRLLLDGDDASRVHTAFVRWDSEVAEWLDERFPGSGISADWTAQGTSPLVVGGGYYDTGTVWLAHNQVVTARLKWLARLGMAGVSRDARTASAAVSKRVFVVHGRDVASRETVCRFLEGVDLEPVVLHEQPSEGRTLIEKFEKYADVGYAVVLLTGDDEAQSEPARREPRARQNVILELGFFLGRLGRARVCPLYQPGVSLPSDYDGVVYVPLDPAGAWKLLLARELKAAGFAVDMNRAV